MVAPKNTFKHALKNKRPQIGCWLALADAYVAEVAITAGFDWLLIDGEHAPNDIRTTLNQLRVIEHSPSHPIVRLPTGDTHLIKQYLDIGVQTLLIPMVESATQARALVQAIHYPPHGKRGVGSALARATKFSTMPVKDYLNTINDEICLLVQVETQAGLDALDDILTVDGVDGVFIGPADLAADLGHLGNPDAPEVQDAIHSALHRIAQSDKAAGFLNFNPEAVPALIKQGVLFLATGGDCIVLAQGMKHLAQKSKSAITGENAPTHTPPSSSY